MHFKALLLTILIRCCVPIIYAAPIEQPPATGHVPLIDEAQLLTNEQSEEISKLAQAHNARGPGRISVRIVKELPPNTTIEKYASDKISQPPAAKTEKLERILIVVAVQNRKLRIETSKEIWALLPDTFCKKVIDDVISPRFKEKQYYQGLHSGINAIIAKLRPSGSVQPIPRLPEKG